MGSHYACNEELVRRLPLPLAQLYRRAHNAKTALEQHLAAYYLWEAALKLLASSAVVCYAELGAHDPKVAKCLTNLARPSLGHWWEFVRLLVPVLADAGQKGYGAVRGLLLGRTCHDLPRCAGLDLALCEALDSKGSTRSTVRLSELFDRLVRYRNQELGHGAAGQRGGAFYERMGQAILAGVAELLQRLDVLAGRRLIHVTDVSRQPSGAWLIQRYALVGETARRIESLELTEAEPTNLPRPELVYLEEGIRVGGHVMLRCLHPLFLYDGEAGEAMFLNARRGLQRIEYLSYTSGRRVELQKLPQEQRALLARVLGAPVGEQQAEVWAARSHAEEQAVAGSPDAGPAPARRLGEFELLSKLGQGGMGVVYRAWQPSLGREVALKCLLRSEDPKAEARFAREIRALGRSDHPNLVKIFTSGSEGSHWFYAMELVEGTTLAAVCDKLQARGATSAGLDLQTWQAALSTVCDEARKAEKSLNDTSTDQPPIRTVATGDPVAAVALAGRNYVHQVVNLMGQVCDAAHALHAAGVVHRDIKPGNIMVSADGHQVVLMDLGLAQLADDVQGRLTRTRQFVGTLRYASPEQMLAVGTLDRRSDVYSLGTTLWELLTLRPMYGAGEQMPEAEVMRRIQFQEPERLRKYQPGIPRDLEAIVLKCLEKDPQRRYPTAQALGEDLQRFLGGEPVQARPVGEAERLWRWCRRNRVVAGLAAAVFAILVVVAVGATLAAFNIASARRQADRKALEASTAQQETQNALNDKNRALQNVQSEFQRAEENAKKARLEQARQSVGQGLRILDDDPLGALLWFVRALERDPEDEVNRRRVAALLREYPLEQMWFDVRHARLSPDGRQVLTTNDRGTARVWDAATGSPVTPPLKHDGPILCGEFSPDGSQVVTAGPLISPHKSLPAPATLMPVPGDEMEGDRKEAWMKGEFKVWNVATGQLLFQSGEHSDCVFHASFSPDGRRLVTASTHGTVQVWDARTGKAVYLPKKIGEILAIGVEGRPVATAVEGQTATWRVVAASDEKTVGVWDLTTGERVASFEVGPGIQYAALSREGRRVVTVRNGRPARQMLGVQSMPVEASPRQASGTDLQWGEAQVWDAGTGKPIGPPLKHADVIHHAVFSADGQWVVTGCADGQARVWEAVTGKAVCPPIKHPGPVVQAALSADGRRLITASAPQAAPETAGLRLAGGEVRVWDIATASPVAPAWPYRNEWPGGPVSFSADGHHALALTSNLNGGEAYLWDLTNSGDTVRLLPDSQGIPAAAFTPDGRHVVPTGAGPWRAWDAATGKPVLSPPPDPGVVEQHTTSYRPEKREFSRTLLDAKAQRLSVIRTETVLVPYVQVHQIRNLEPAPNQSAKRPTSPSLSGTLYLVSSSNDGTRLVSDNLDLPPGVQGEARVWDEAGKPLTPPLKHHGHVTAAAFSADLRFLVTVCEHYTVQLWDLQAGEPVTPPLRHSKKVLEISLSPDGRRVVTVCGDIWLWEMFPSEQRPAEVMGPLARVLAGRRIDPTGELEYSDARRLHSDWETFLFHTHPEKGFAGEDARLAWHQQKAQDAQEAGLSSMALLHLQRLIEARPKDGALYGNRGYAHADLGKWPEATADYGKALELGAEDAGVWYQAALLRLRAGDTQGYRASCANLLRRFGGTGDAKTAEVVLRACALIPDAVADLRQPLQLAERAVAQEPSNPDRALLLGALLYRAGKLDAALLKLQQVEPQQQQWELRGPNDLYLRLLSSLVLYHLGKREEAGTWMSFLKWSDFSDRERLQGQERLRGRLTYSIFWDQHLELQVLHREADGLIPESLPPRAPEQVPPPPRAPEKPSPPLPPKT